METHSRFDRRVLPYAAHTAKPACQTCYLSGRVSRSAKGKGFHLDSRLFKGVKGGGGSSLYRLVTSCLAVTSRKDDRPPTHFFVKKKIIPIGGAETTTQTVPSGLLLRSYFLRGEALYDARNPPVRATAWRRHPCHAPDVPSERMREGTAVGPEGRRRWKDSLRGTEYPIRTYRSEALSQVCTETPCGAGTTTHPGGSFFLYEKSVLQESDSLRGREREVCTDSTTPFPPLKKPLKIMGIQGESLPDAPPAAHLSAL